MIHIQQIIIELNVQENIRICIQRLCEILDIDPNYTCRGGYPLLLEGYNYANSILFVHLIIVLYKVKHIRQVIFLLTILSWLLLPSQISIVHLKILLNVFESISVTDYGEDICSEESLVCQIVFKPLNSIALTHIPCQFYYLSFMFCLSPQGLFVFIYIYLFFPNFMAQINISHLCFKTQLLLSCENFS